MFLFNDIVNLGISAQGQYPGPNDIKAEATFLMKGKTAKEFLGWKISHYVLYQNDNYLTACIVHAFTWGIKLWFTV